MSFVSSKGFLIAVAVVLVIVLIGIYMVWFGGTVSQTETPVQQEAPAQTQ